MSGTISRQRIHRSEYDCQTQFVLLLLLPASGTEFSYALWMRMVLIAAIPAMLPTITTAARRPAFGILVKSGAFSGGERLVGDDLHAAGEVSSVTAMVYQRARLPPLPMTRIGDVMVQRLVEVAGSELVRARLALGETELLVCSDGSFLLDGGAMFGVVPKTLWQKRMPADEDNRVLLGLNTVVVRTGAAVVVIETGIGNKQSPKMRAIHQNQELLPASLAAAGVALDEVTHVVNTHLHFDHCGWNTTVGEHSVARPTFPNARYFASAGELAHGRLQLDRDRVSYLSANYDPLLASGQMTLLDLDGRGGYVPGDLRLLDPAANLAVPHAPVETTSEITPGVWVEQLPGHTETMLAVHIESGGEHACYVSDLMPTSRHLDPTWVMGFDLDPLRVIEERKKFLQRAIEGRWLVLFTHDHAVPGAYLAWDERGKPAVRRGLPLAATNANEESFHAPSSLS